MLAGYKTYIVAAVAVITAIAAWATGDATISATIQLVVTAIIGATLKHGMANGK